jgi:hypothetical protein
MVLSSRQPRRYFEGMAGRELLWRGEVFSLTQREGRHSVTLLRLRSDFRNQLSSRAGDGPGGSTFP